MDFATYLKDEMGLRIECDEWLGASDLPLYLMKAADYRICSCNQASFIVAQVDGSPGLPELKRISAQVSHSSQMPVVLVAHIDARQRRALVSQGIAFIVPGKQAFLPMVGFAGNSRREAVPLGEFMAPVTQAVFVALLANPGLRTSADLIRVTRMLPVSVSRALDELARRGLIYKSKEGRQVVFTCERGNDLIRKAMGCLRTPVMQALHVRKDERTSLLPLAGESVLSERSMLAPPKVECRAVSKAAFGDCDLQEVVPGELPNEQTVMVQVWSYDPLVSGGPVVDDVSLALSFSGEDDERVIGQLNDLFQEELW